MKLCPCGSSRSLNNCCALIHANQQLAVQAEQLMRARYTAFVQGDVNFIINTYHSSCNAAREREQILQSTQLQWVKLAIVDAKTTSLESSESFVEFKAWYMENDALQLLHERSRFIKETIDQDSYWRYIDGTYPQLKQETKTKRNDPCPCNSGKKFKKCCA